MESKYSNYFFSVMKDNNFIKERLQIILIQFGKNREQSKSQTGLVETT